MLDSFAGLIKPVLMQYEVYKGIAVSEDYSQFDFVSHGRNGPIRKRVAFTSTEMDKVYHLAFGDVREDGELDDLAVSDNGDRNKVLATVVNIVTSYTNRYPDRWIAFKGSTEQRTRLYRMAVGLHLEELSLKFEIYGLISEQVAPFTKDMKINAFLIVKKNG